MHVVLEQAVHGGVDVVDGDLLHVAHDAMLAAEVQHLLRLLDAPDQAARNRQPAHAHAAMHISRPLCMHAWTLQCMHARSETARAIAVSAHHRPSTSACADEPAQYGGARNSACMPHAMHAARPHRNQLCRQFLSPTHHACWVSPGAVMTRGGGLGSGPCSLRAGSLQEQS